MNGATASCIAACAAALGVGSGSPPASRSAQRALGGDAPRRQPGARGSAEAAGSPQRGEGRRDAAGLHAEQRIGRPRFRDRRQRGMAQSVHCRRGLASSARRLGQARQRRVAGGAGQSSGAGATAPNSRASAPDAASARPRRMAASARAIASDASEP